jgi:DNA-cytosine methyltransferase
MTLTEGSITDLPNLWIVEDDAQTNSRQHFPGVASRRRTIVIQLHKVVDGKAKLVRSTAYDAGHLSQTGGQRADLAHTLLKSARARDGIVVAGASYGSSRTFIADARMRGLDVAVEVRGNSVWSRVGQPHEPLPIRSLLGNARWTTIDVASDETQCRTEFQAADLGKVSPNGVLRAIALAPGSIADAEGDIRFAVTSLLAMPLRDLVMCLAWVRWIRTLNRRRMRELLMTVPSGRIVQSQRPPLLTVSSRPNIRLARQQDLQLTAPIDVGGRQSIRSKPTVIELFAGAGGLGLGFLLAGNAGRTFRLMASAEVHPIFVRTLRQNHGYLAAHLSRQDDVPQDTRPIDLRTRAHQAWLKQYADQFGGVDVVVGGPPCQGFSMANRNSWSASNPNNRLVDTFVSLVRKLQPRFALLENVQGILWTERSGKSTQLSVADSVARALRRAGYLPFAKLLDAVWYGVPQHRARFFLLAIHEDVGYSADDFDSWGPFPQPTHGPARKRPYTTVADAIGDLPPVSNGNADEVLAYEEPGAATLASNRYLADMRAGAESGSITDHVTSRHAPYVIERYSQIPQGGNWNAIANLLTNYADVDRTHSNIYRRLKDDEPAITIGHYRKSMLVHPTQNRGLSLREAARLQSFPDWFRFAGAADGGTGGLMHKQQQLANAVCPLMSKAIGEFILRL